ncbi:MAG: hypothetical protein AABZ24_10220 [Nitrospirota bacterium]
MLIHDADAVLPEDEEEYETLLEILSDAGEAWSKGQTAEGRRAPFHVCLTVTEQNQVKRTHWHVKEFSPTELATPKTKPSLKRAPKRSKK